MCGRYSVQKKTLLVANSLVKKNINVDLEHDNFNCAHHDDHRHDDHDDDPCVCDHEHDDHMKILTRTPR